MHSSPSSKTLAALLAALAALIVASVIRAKSPTGTTSTESAARAADNGCPSDDAHLKLPRGFCATVFADGVGHARHMVSRRRRG